VTDDQHGEGRPQNGGRWDPLPQGDYDDGATAFVKLPEGGIDALLAADSPLAAPGHGYVPPQITVATDAGADPAATGSWAMPAEGVQWPDPNAVPHQGGADDRFAYHPGATGQWTFEDSNAQEAGAAPGHDVTGQWSIPVAGGDLPDESGEFTTSSLVEQWGGTPPATLPGGAPAPWATEGAGQPWGQQASGAGVAERPGTHTDERPPAETAGEVSAVAATRPPTDVRDLADATGRAPADPYGEARADPYAHTRTDPYGDAPADLYADAPADPYADAAPAELAGAAAQSAPGADGAAGHTEDDEGAAEASEGPAEPPAAAGPGDDAEGGPEAAETVVTAAESAAADEPEAADETGESGERAPALPGEEHPLASYVLRVNGADRPVPDAWIGESLLYVLRERLGLAGAKDGCSQGECGACNVQVDGRLVASCLVPAVTAAGSEVRTVEGLAVEGQPSDVQRALAKCGAVQCGFCVPGMAMTVHDLLEGNPAPTELEARQALCGNLCRCSGYRGVLDAVQEVVAEREAHAAAAGPESDGDEARIPHQAGPGAGGVHQSAFESPRTHDQAYGQDGGQA